MRYLHIFLLMTSANLRGLMAYKVDFLVSFFGGLLSQTVGLIFIGVLFQNIPEIAGWNLYEVGMLYGYMYFAEGILTLSFQGTHNLVKLVRNGLLDCFLTRPIPLSLQIYGLQTNLAGFGTAITGLVVMMISIRMLEIVITLRFVVLFVVSLVLGTMIRINISFACSSIGFWFRDASGVRQIVYKLQDMAKYPIDMYPKAFQVILMTMIPFAVISYVPTAVLLGKKEIGFFMLLPVVTISIIFVRKGMFQCALKRYEGSGS